MRLRETTGAKKEMPRLAPRELEEKLSLSRSRLGRTNLDSGTCWRLHSFVSPPAIPHISLTI